MPGLEQPAGVKDALNRLAHVEALAILFHAIVEDKNQGLFGRARAALSRDIPDNARLDEETTRLAGLLSDAYRDGTPASDAILSENPLLLAAALGKQLGESFLSSPCVPVDIPGGRFHAFRVHASRLSKDWASPRYWFQPIWFVGAHSGGKEVKISRVDWHDGTAPCCALIEFDDGVGLNQEIIGDTFIVRGLLDEDARWNSLAIALQTASEGQAQILVLPELSLTQPLLEKLSAWLREKRHPFRLVAAGSHHHREPSDALACNRMTVLDRRGLPLLHHDKWYEFDVSRREKIRPGDTVQLLFAPPGLLSFAICKDFCHVDGFDWKALALDGLCVASMGDEKTLSAHHAAARTMKLAGARVLLANNTENSDGTWRGFFSPPGADPRGNGGNVTLKKWSGIPKLTVIKQSKS